MKRPGVSGAVVHRLHLCDDQRALIGAKVRSMFEEEAQSRQLSRALAPIDAKGKLSEHPAVRT